MPFSFYSPQSPGKKSLRRRFPVLLPVLVFILLFAGYQLVNLSSIKPAIGVVQIEGVILDSESVIKKLRILENDSTVKGIIVRINSPGGAVSPSQEIFKEILRLKTRKKVYVSVSSSAASGGYYIAVAADKIFANPGSIVGSIGTIIQTFNVKKLMTKLGIESEIIKSGPNKDIGSVFRKMKPGEKKLLQSVIDDTHEQFILAISDNRPLDIKQVKAIADGRIFTGKQAKELGLIDTLASFRETATRMKQDLNIDEEINLIYPPDKEDYLQNIFDMDALLGIKEIAGFTGLYYLASSLLE
jgi:protease IV